MPIRLRALSTISASRGPQTREVFVPEFGTSFPSRWLRDSCQCSICIHPSTRQKLHRTSDIPSDVYPMDATVADGQLRVTWGLRNALDKVYVHKSAYDLSWLKAYSNEKDRKSFHLDTDRIFWTPTKLRTAPHLFVDYSQLQSDDRAVHLSAITQLIEYGLLFVNGVPVEAKDDVGCELRRLVTKFGRLRNTFYGEVWDVMNVKNSANIAYTNLDLGLHMDLLYFQHPPRYQILHSLRNRVRGGTSIFVDAVHTAQKLYSVSTSAFDILTRTPVAFHYINNGHHLHHAHPTIALAPFAVPTGESGAPPPIAYINYSPPFQAPLPLTTPDNFYEALKNFSDLMENDRYEYTLKEGDAVIFDNRRVLHARTEFMETGATPEGETSRWLKGCYFEEDDVLDISRHLNKRREQALSS